jgi:hypothetical protein
MGEKNTNKKPKFKIGPNISISKGSFNPNPEVQVDTENRYYGLKGEANIFDTDTTNFKITGSLGKGSGRADVTHPGGTDTYKGEGSLDKQIGFKFTKKFSSGRLPKKANQYSSGGGVAIKGTKFTGVF